MICSHCKNEVEYGVLTGKEVLSLITSELEDETDFCITPSCPICKKPSLSEQAPTLQDT